MQRNKKVNNRARSSYTARYLLGYKYIKNRYRLIAIDLSRQKELDADPKVMHQIEFFG